MQTNQPLEPLKLEHFDGIEDRIKATREAEETEYALAFQSAKKIGSWKMSLGDKITDTLTESQTPLGVFVPGIVTREGDEAERDAITQASILVSDLTSNPSPDIQAHLRTELRALVEGPYGEAIKENRELQKERYKREPEERATQLQFLQESGKRKLTIDDLSAFSNGEVSRFAPETTQSPTSRDQSSAQIQ